MSSQANRHSLWDNTDAEPWDKDLPEDLVAAIKPLRKMYGRDHILVGLPIRQLCYARLHNELGAQQQEHLDTFKKLQSHVSRDLNENFAELIRQGTLPAIFKAYFDFYVGIMTNYARLIFGHLLEVGIANESRLASGGVQWAEAQTRHLIRSHRHSIKLWVREVCDKTDFDFRAGVDEFWSSWRAPSFLVMKPSRYGIYALETVWERKDGETSLGWLEALADDYVIRLEMKIEELAASALLERAKHPKLEHRKAPANPTTNGPLQAADVRVAVSNANQPPSEDESGIETDDAPWQRFSSDFAKLAAEERSANALALGVMAHPESNPSSDLADWGIHNGYSENFKARFELLASQAGRALGRLPDGASPFFYWLHRLYQNLCENRSSLSSRFIIGSSVEAPVVDSVCEASSTFCLRIQKRALECDQDRRTLSACFQDWIENNFVSESIPGQISDRIGVSIVAGCARTSIPIEFLSSRLQRISLPRGSTAFGSPREFFDNVADTHGLIWVITRNGLWMAQQPPSAGLYVDANGSQRGETTTQESVPPTERAPIVQSDVRSDAQALTRSEVIDGFIDRILKERGIKVSRADINRVAGYSDRRQIERWQSGELKSGSKPDMNFKRVLALLSEEFLQRLQTYKASSSRR